MTCFLDQLVRLHNLCCSDKDMCILIHNSIRNMQSIAADAGVHGIVTAKGLNALLLIIGLYNSCDARRFLVTSLSTAVTASISIKVTRYERRLRSSEVPSRDFRTRAITGSHLRCEGGVGCRFAVLCPSAWLWMNHWLRLTPATAGKKRTNQSHNITLHHMMSPTELTSRATCIIKVFENKDTSRYYCTLLQYE